MLWRFLRAVKNREHRVAPTTAVAATAAVIYAFVPIDLIPELVLGPLGFADDISLWTIFAVLFAREQRRWLAGLASDQPSDARLQAGHTGLRG
ncbi:MAG: YkvA family protein [Microbacterium sp.]